MKIRLNGMRTLCSAVVLCAALTSCVQELAVTRLRHDTTERLARPAFMFERHIPADPFLLTAWERVREPGGPATVYIEGDGYAWASRRRPSLDPTPANPVALHLATRDVSPNVLYLARPCQYTRLVVPDTYCPMPYWTGKRFAPEVLSSMDAALDDMKQRYRITSFNLVGYSGGGGLAVLLAAARDDVASIRTVAANLDTDTFTDMHLVSRMEGSINPLHSAEKVAHIPQHHFIGAWDEVVTGVLFERFRAAAGPQNCLRSTVVREADHETGWVNKWPALQEAPLDCGNIE